MMLDSICKHIHVSTPQGNSLVVNRVYRYFLVSVDGCDTWVDLIGDCNL